MQTLEKALKNLVHNMEILRETLNKQHQVIEELDTKINELDSKLNEVKEKVDALGR